MWGVVVETSRGGPWEEGEGLVTLVVAVEVVLTVAYTCFCTLCSTVNTTLCSPITLLGTPVSRGWFSGVGRGEGKAGGETGAGWRRGGGGGGLGEAQ